MTRQLIRVEGIDEVGRFRRSDHSAAIHEEMTPEEYKAIVGCPHNVLRMLPKEKGFTLSNTCPSQLNAGKMDLLIARDLMKTKRDIVRSVKGVGSLKAEKFNNTIDVMNDAIHALDNDSDPIGAVGQIEEDILSGVYQNEVQMAGIGSVDEIGKARAKASAQRAQKRAKTPKTKNRPMKTKTGKFLKNAAKKVKAGAKAFKKVVTAPQRVAVKIIMERLLPASGLFFLYLFINEPVILAKLPKKVKRKREKAERVKNFITKLTGMSDAHFMGIARNGIMKKAKVSPETLLSRKIKGIQGVNGIGAIPPDLITSVLPLVIEIINKLAVAFKQPKQDVSKDDAPDLDNDFDELDEKQKTEMSSDIKKQNDDPEPIKEVAPPKMEPMPKDNQETASGGSSGSSSESSSSGSGSSSSSGSASESSSGGSGGTGSSSSSESTSENTNAELSQTLPGKDTNAEGEIINTNASASSGNNFSTGGRKGWNSLGGNK